VSDSPASGIMAAPHLPWHSGACGAVNTPAPPFYSARREQRAAEHEQRVHDRWTRSTDGTQLPANPRCPVGDARLTNSSGIECPAVNAATVSPRIGRTVSDPSTSTGNTGARESSVGQARKAEASVPAAPTVGHEPTSTGEADAGAKVSLPTRGGLSDAAKPTLKPCWRRSPWWMWT